MYTWALARAQYIYQLCMRSYIRALTENVYAWTHARVSTSYDQSVRFSNRRAPLTTCARLNLLCASIEIHGTINIPACRSLYKIVRGFRRRSCQRKRKRGLPLSESKDEDWFAAARGASRRDFLSRQRIPQSRGWKVPRQKKQTSSPLHPLTPLRCPFSTYPSFLSLSHRVY